MSPALSPRAAKRHAEILRLAREQGSCRVSDLAEHFGVTLETIRRDIAPLAESGQIVKLHGYVTLPDGLKEPSFHARMLENPKAKQQIARAIYDLIGDGTSVMMETGSTLTHIAMELYRRSTLIVITNSLEAARILSVGEGNRIYVAGGELDIDDGAALGRSAVDYIRGFTAEFGIISANAINTRRGLTKFEPLNSEFGGVVLEQSTTRICAIDSSKFEREALTQVCEFSEIDILVTDARPGEELHRALDEAEVEIIVAD